MAKSEFKNGTPTKVTNAKAIETAKENDLKQANFHIPAETGAKITFTGDFYTLPWERFEGEKKKGEGTTLCAEFNINGTKKVLSLSFLRTKRMREEDGLLTCKGVFSPEASLEEIVKGLHKNDVFVVTRTPYVYPGRSSARDIDTLTKESEG